jgi:hypothetical protein
LAERSRNMLEFVPTKPNDLDLCSRGRQACMRESFENLKNAYVMWVDTQEGQAHVSQSISTEHDPRGIQDLRGVFQSISLKSRSGGPITAKKAPAHL